MQDRSWMLNRSAISSAKRCIQLIQLELGVRLKLSHPDFMLLIAEYCELTGSEGLSAAYQELLDYADSSLAAVAADDEQVEYMGRQYSRYDVAGREFQGLYRGAARYI
jgi:hypothetical protein